MATKKIGLGKYVKAAKEAPQERKPEQGWRGRVRIKKVFVNETKGGDPRWGLLLEYVEGENKGDEFFADLMFTSNERANQRTLAAMEAIGLDIDFIEESDADQVGSAMEGKVFILVAGYQEKKDTPGEYWDRHTFVAAKEDKPARKRRPEAEEVPAEDELPEETGDEGDDFFDEDEEY